MRKVWCSFCGREERECTLLVVGPDDVGARTAAICKDCIGEVAGLAARHAVRNKPDPVNLVAYREAQRVEALYRYGDDPGDAA